MARKYVSWRRVSTKKQGNSGLGLEAQKEIIRFFVERASGEWIADYEECYTGTELSGCVELRKAMEHAKKEDAILIIAKSDRFRNTIEALQVYEEMGEGQLMFCDLPRTDKFTLTLFFALAEREALLVSIRTKQALAAKKARGEALGANCEKWQMAYKSKAKDVLKEENARRGRTKNERYLQSQDVQALFKALRNVFPSACRNNDPLRWSWKQINTRMDAKHRIMALMKDYKELDVGGTLFQDWDFAHNDEKLNVKLSSFLHNVKASIRKYNSRKNYE